MAIWQIKNAKGLIRYRARMVGTFPGKRLNATFETREEAEQWVAKIKQQRAQVRKDQAGRDRV